MNLITFIQNDLPSLLAAVLASVACAVVGALLVLRRMSLMGDAISHAVLPGIVAAFVIGGSLQAWPVFIGAVLIGVLTSLLTDTIHRLGRVESNAAMGVVFTVLFAIGVIWMTHVGGKSTVHLDPDCVLYGDLQNIVWIWPDMLGTDGRIQFTPRALAELPGVIWTLLGVALLVIGVITVLFKEFRLTAFDAELAAALGFRPGLMHYVLMTLVAISTVASFEAVGSILVVAMLIVPGLCAHLLTDRLSTMLVLSALIAAVAAVGGYVIAALLHVNAAGMIGVTLGGLLAITTLISPQHGWLIRLWRRRHLRLGMLREDVLGRLYRRSEETGTASATPAMIAAWTGSHGQGERILKTLIRRGEARHAGASIELTDAGLTQARELIRSHRLWESYLVQKLELPLDHVHERAHQLEHITDADLRQRLSQRLGSEVDPHGRAIPPPHTTVQHDDKGATDESPAH